MNDFVGFVLRLVGVFYLAAAVLGVRSVAMDDFLSRAIASIAPEKPAVRAAERWRTRYLIVSLALTGLGAIALIALLEVAAALFLVAALIHVIFMAVLAPRFVDPSDPPDPGSRARSWRAAAMFGAVTVLVAAAAWTGILRPLAADSIGTALATVGAIAFLGYAGWTLKPWRPATTPFGQRSASWQDGEEPASDASSWTPYLPDNIDSIVIVLTPSWMRGGLLDADTGKPLTMPVEHALVPEPERELISDWLTLFVDVADPYDPRRCALREADGLARLEEVGRPIADRLTALLGPERVRFEPMPRPCGPEIELTAVEIMADYRCEPVWSKKPGDFSESVNSDLLGISWNLARELDAWSFDFDDGIDWDDPGGPSRWSAAESAAHDARGRVLADRLAQEFRETDRAHVTVSYRGANPEPRKPEW